jgi:hypothetical protein
LKRRGETFEFWKKLFTTSSAATHLRARRPCGQVVVNSFFPKLKSFAPVCPEGSKNSVFEIQIFD